MVWNLPPEPGLWELVGVELSRKGGVDLEQWFHINKEYEFYDDRRIGVVAQQANTKDITGKKIHITHTNKYI